MALTKFEVDNLKSAKASYRKNDGNGLYIEIYPNGKKFWRLRITYKGKQKVVSLGEYPQLGIKEARLSAIKARSEIIHAKKPAGTKFEVYASDWYNAFVKGRVADSTAKTTLSRMTNHVIPLYGEMPITSIKSADIRKLVTKLTRMEQIPTINKCLSIISRIFRYAISEDENLVDPTIAISDYVPPHKVKHFAAILTRPEIAVMMANFQSYPTIITRNALLFTAYTFCRTSEIRFSKWNEMDLEERVWRIPASRIKARRVHIIPLSNQAVAILEKMKVVTEGYPYVFPSQRNFNKPMSENCMLKAVRRWYDKDTVTPHGLRATASTLLNESGLWHSDAIELQMAHVDEDPVRASYNYAMMLPERRAMVQWYADLLDAIRDGAPTPVKPEYDALG